LRIHAIRAKAPVTSIDLEWFLACHSAGLVRSRLLEVGSAKVQGLPNLCDAAGTLGITDSIGVDLDSADGVDTVIDLGLSLSQFRERYCLGRFATVCVFNVLEHTFDPYTVLQNAMSCADAGGSLLVVTPSIWPIHNYPGDYNRLLPDWYREFAKRTGLELIEQHFCWLSQFGIEPIRRDGSFPTYMSRKARASRIRYWTSRVTHRVGNTYGRSHWATHCAIGAAFAVPS